MQFQGTSLGCVQESDSLVAYSCSDVKADEQWKLVKSKFDKSAPVMDFLVAFVVAEVLLVADHGLKFNGKSSDLRATQTLFQSSYLKCDL